MNHQSKVPGCNLGTSPLILVVVVIRREGRERGQIPRNFTVMIPAANTKGRRRNINRFAPLPSHSLSASPSIVSKSRQTVKDKE